MDEVKAGLEVTPEMVEAGFQALRGSGIADFYLEADKVAVAEIYTAMERCRIRLAKGDSR